MPHSLLGAGTGERYSEGVQCDGHLAERYPIAVTVTAYGLLSPPWEWTPSKSMSLGF